VFLYSRSSNDGLPYREWKCDSLTEVYKSEGQRGLDREIVRMLCEYAEIKGNHASMARYRPCLSASKQLHTERTRALDAEYAKLTPEDIKTIWLPDEKKTDAARAYRQFAKSVDDAHYTRLAEFVAPPVAARHSLARSGGAR